MKSEDEPAQEREERQEKEEERKNCQEKGGNNERMKRCGLQEVKRDDWRESFCHFSWQHIPAVFISQ